MSNPNEQEDEAQSGSNEQGNKIDFLLSFLVCAANKGDFECTITINVSGLLISGILTNGKKVFDGWLELYSDSSASDFNSTFSEILREASTIHQKKVFELTDDDLEYPCKFIHIRDAQFFTSSHSNLTEITGQYWRGKLESVDGFVLGKLQQIPRL